MTGDEPGAEPPTWVISFPYDLGPTSSTKEDGTVPYKIQVLSTHLVAKYFETLY